ncbi:hypothetical protein ACFVVA_13475 [Kitasatospora sp. NPDC058048]|uniref:hypothetical protein n=1 Tax=Kitasatospora sp. NPDC058048 TaxID=3346313 RepID=UPI0036DCC16D
MNFKSKSLPILLVLVCGSAPVLAGRLSGWPVWLDVFLAMTVAAGLCLLVTRRPVPSPQVVEVPPEPLYVGPGAPVEPPFRETRVEGLALPSALPDYSFVFSATVRWRPTHNLSDLAHANLVNLAVSAVLERAQFVTNHEHPYHSVAAGYRLAGTLGAEAADASARVTSLATDVSLTLYPADHDRLEKLARLHKTEDAWEQHRHYERNRRTYLGEEVLKSPGSAVVWWLTRHEDEVEKAVDMIGPLAQLSAAANNTEVPEPFRRLVAGASTPGPVCPMGDPASPEHPAEDRAGVAIPLGPSAPPVVEPDEAVVEHIRQLLDELGLKEGSAEREVLVHRIARSTDAAGRVAAAERIRQHLSGRWPGKASPAEETQGEQSQMPTPSPGSGGTVQEQRAEHQGHRDHGGQVDQVPITDRAERLNTVDDYYDMNRVTRGALSRHEVTDASMLSAESEAPAGQEPSERGWDTDH